MSDSNREKKIVFFVKSVRFLRYFKSVLTAFLEMDYRVTAVFDASKIEPVSDDSLKNLQSRFPFFAWKNGPLRTDIFRRLVIASRNILNYQFLLRRGVVAWRLKRHFDYLPIFLQKFILIVTPFAKVLIKSGVAEFVCRSVEKIVPPDEGITSFLRSLKSDALIVSYRSFPCLSPDIDYVKSGMALGIPTTIIIPSWDQPTTKSLIQIIPDKVFVWNEEHASVLSREHAVPRNKIVISGAPQFDVFFERKTPFRSINDFLSIYRITAGPPFVLYIASSGERDSALVKELSLTLSSNSDGALQSITILVRPYPGRENCFADLKLQNVKVLPAPLEGRRSLDDDQDFFDAIYHSFATIALSSTALLDTIAIGRPSIMYFDKRHKEIQSDAHLETLYRSGAFYTAYNLTELMPVLKRINAGDDFLREKRHDYICKFIRPQGSTKSAAAVVVEEIGKLLSSRVN
ncbi:MAG: hypothetical protein UY17_C0025G0005 [Candidatus Beckwithbacteria bacterium GW2011_GWC2_47_9]|uniref:Uncharacterized protein n=1 Tax=Candidatus Beckwithbacteria bacterium GW2011_GWC2_47_9 TaxID=1618373 RepID=A0A0G1TZF7_9BACT|nr:MAG: hypothetical protein UX94_C0004G0021 [Parcubacteria group bacterium GW2011_GWA2_47_21]KKU87206.1 MAG: hypothetical protein UY17_C0025G0005 [Candidatus Beckwithbacteria bacterium GW2011_GWC2_47_9]